MNWAQIKKSINSNLNIPLNEVIGTKDASASEAVNATNTAMSMLKGQTHILGGRSVSAATAVNTTNSLMAYIKGIFNIANNYSPIKSIQRGSHSGGTSGISLNIATVDPAKCTVTIYPATQSAAAVAGSGGSSGGAVGSFPRVTGLSANQLTVSASSSPSISTEWGESGTLTRVSVSAASFSWEIVEFK
jgi:hypothetical protein